MTWSIPLGPLVLPAQFLLLCLSAGLGLWLGERRARRAGGSVERELQGALLVGVVVARLAFVAQHREAYLAQPWSMFDIRDGGWSPWPGLAAAWFYGVMVTRRPSTKRRPVVLGLGVASTLWVAGLAALLLASPSVQRLPAFSSLTMQGERVDLGQLTGQPTVINLWATWCPPCRREMPVLARAQAERPGVRFIFLNQGEAPATIARYLQAEGLDLRNVVLDLKAEVGRHYGSGGLPLTLFFDAQGRLQASRMGELSRATLQLHLQAIGVR